MIIQINVYICEGEDCSNTVVLKENVDIWSDPLVSLPEKWDYEDHKLLCPDCAGKEIRK